MSAPVTTPPPKTKYAAGLLVTVGGLALVAAGIDLARSTPPAAGFHAEHGYDEGIGSDGYHFRYHLSASGPGAERPLFRGLATVAGIGFLAFGVRLWAGSAVTLLPAAGFAVLAGTSVAYAGVKAAGDGRATLGLPAMGVGFVLVVAAALLGAGRRDYRKWRADHVTPPTKLSTAGQFAGILLLLYGLAVIGFAVYRTAASLEPVRGRSTVIGLRAGVATSTSIESLGELMKASAEKSQSFTVGPGFFLHPQAVAAVWGGLWATAGLGVLLGRAPRRLGFFALAAAVGVTVFAILAVKMNFPWYAATPDSLFPGGLVLLVPGALLLRKRQR
jgi:hypothetical protein